MSNFSGSGAFCYAPKFTFRSFAGIALTASSFEVQTRKFLNEEERGVAQLASVRALGAWGPGFESRLPDQNLM